MQLETNSYPTILDFGQFHHKLEVSSHALISMIKALEACYPNEGCGFLFGKQGESRQITYAAVVPNAGKEDQRRRFAIHPIEYMKAEKFAQDQGLDLLGIFHSHPDHPAIPSQHDLDMAVPFFSYIILSVRAGKAETIRSWRLAEQASLFVEEKLA